MVHYVSNSYYLVIKKPENKTSLFLPWQEPKLIFSHFCQVWKNFKLNVNCPFDSQIPNFQGIINFNISQKI